MRCDAPGGRARREAQVGFGTVKVGEANQMFDSMLPELELGCRFSNPA